MTDWHLNHPDLASALASAAGEFSDRLEHWQTQPNNPQLERQLLQRLAAQDVSNELANLLSSREPFAGGAGFYVANLNGYSGFHADDAANQLIRRVTAGLHTPEAALQWLTQLLKTPSGRGVAVTALWGIECTNAVDLTSDVRLVPMASLAETEAKAWVLRPQNLGSRPSGLGLLSRAPTAALVAPATIAPLLHRASLGDPPSQDNPFDLQNHLDDARLALTLCGPSHPIPAAHWFDFDDADIRSTFGSGGISLRHVEVVPAGFEPLPPLEATQAKRVVTAFLAMPTGVQTKVRLALSRYNQAMRRPARGDRALDLAIALESLLVDNAGENTYKFGLRAALLLGGPLSERMKNRALITALYAIRSTLVHDGVLPSTVKVAGIGKRPSFEVVAEAAVLGGKILERIIEMQHIPDWHEYELQP